MKKASKKYCENKKKVESNKKLLHRAALDILMQMAHSKFDETVDVAIRLGVDPKQSDQQVRGAVVLPNGTGKKTRILVFAKGEKEKEAEESGADVVGSTELIEKIEKGWLDFDKVIATPDLMGVVSKLGKVLGPRGLMPNPKLGTVTFDVGQAVKNERKGKVEFKADKVGIIHTFIGKVSFGTQKLSENFIALIDEIKKQKPASSKGVYLKSVAISTTQSPSVRIDTHSLLAKSEEV